MVQLRVANHLVGAMLDRFGKNTVIIPDGENHFTTQVSVIVSSQFFGWICGLGPDIVITGPEQVVEKMDQHITSIVAQYKAL